MKSQESRSNRRLAARFCLLALLIAGTTGTADAFDLTDIQFSGAWSSDIPTPDTDLYLADDLADFNAEIAARLLAGDRLVAFESWLSEGTRRYGGIFRPHPRATYLFVDYSSSAFYTQRVAQFALNRRLLDVEVQLVNGSRRYSGLWEQMSSTVTESAVNNVDADGLEATWNALKDDYHLATFDTWWQDGEARFYAVFHAGAERSYAQLTLAQPMSIVPALFDLATFYGYRLENFEITAVPDDELLVSFKWIPSAQRSWLGINYKEEWMDRASGYLEAGHNFTGADDEFDLGDILPTPLEDPIYLFDFEMTAQLFHYEASIPELTKPLVNSGTPGPPKP